MAPKKSTLANMVYPIVENASLSSTGKEDRPSWDAEIVDACPRESLAKFKTEQTSVSKHVKRDALLRFIGVDTVLPLVSRKPRTPTVHLFP